MPTLKRLFTSVRARVKKAKEAFKAWRPRDDGHKVGAEADLLESRPLLLNSKVDPLYPPHHHSSEVEKPTPNQQNIEALPHRHQDMSRPGKLAPEVNRALFVKNLSYNVSPEDLFELFSKFGPVRQVRAGITANTKGTAFVVFQDAMDAKQACDKLNGFNFQGRYLVVLYHQPEKMQRSREDLETRQENLERLKQQHGID